MEAKNAGQFSLAQRLVCAAILKRYSSAVDVFNFTVFQINFEKQKALPHIPKVIYEAKLNAIDAIFETLKQKHCFDIGVQVRRLSIDKFSVDFDGKIDRRLTWPNNFLLAKFFHGALESDCASLLPSFCIVNVARVLENGFENERWHYSATKDTKSNNLKVIVRLLKN